MITYTQGNLLEADTEVLVNTVNTVGIMGKGIALMFKERYPQNMQAYAHACEQQKVKVGKMFVTPTEELLGAKWIVNFPTKQHWRNPSKMEWIDSGLQDLQRFIIENNIQSIAIPPLGAGNGGLEWNNVKIKIEQHLSSLADVRIVIYEPTPTYQNTKKNSGATKLTPARALVLELIRQYLSVGMDCSEVEVQKMVYFLTRIIQAKNMKDPFRLTFKANKYGLYAHNLTHLLNSLDGYYISADKRIADSHASEPVIRFNYQYQDEVQQYLQKHHTEFMPALSQTLQMIEMFESPFGMELLATVDWLISKKKVKPSLNAVKESLHHWFFAFEDNQGQQRKSHMLNDKAIITALERLRGFSYEPSALTH